MAAFRHALASNFVLCELKGVGELQTSWHETSWLRALESRGCVHVVLVVQCIHAAVVLFGMKRYNRAKCLRVRGGCGE